MFLKFKDENTSSEVVVNTDFIVRAYTYGSGNTAIRTSDGFEIAVKMTLQDFENVVEVERKRLAGL